MKNVLQLESTHSTNKIAFEMAQKGAPHGFAVIADTQTGGRGRLGKTWQSVVGKGLYCSIVLRPKLPVSDYPKITMTAGLAVAEALEGITGLEFGLKWPNDIYCRQKKCCGILCESSILQQDDIHHFAIVGIGININTDTDDFQKELRATATSLLMETGVIFGLETIFEEVRKHVLEKLAELEKLGFKPILSRWKLRDVLLGKKLEWVTNSGEVILGTSLGADETGQLLVRDEQGKDHLVLSGDVTLASR